MNKKKGLQEACFQATSHAAGPEVLRPEVLRPEVRRPEVRQPEVQSPQGRQPEANPRAKAEAPCGAKGREEEDERQAFAQGADRVPPRSPGSATDFPRAGEGRSAHRRHRRSHLPIAQFNRRLPRAAQAARTAGAQGRDARSDAGASE